PAMRHTASRVSIRPGMEMWRSVMSESSSMSATPAIAVSGVSREFHRPRTSLRERGPVVRAVQDVSVDIAPGERFGIVGESGSGKSTLLRMMCGLDQPTSGSIDVTGRPIVGQSWRDLRWLRGQLQVVFQDPMSSLNPRMSVGDIIAEPLVAQRMGDRASRVARVEELLTAVGMPTDVASRYPHQFSGGQRQRISIARALAPSPAILVADEPVSALDVSVRAQVLNLLDDVVGGFDLTLVFVSHDLSVVRHVCERVAVMKAGEFVEVAPTEQLFNDPQHPYTRQLLAAIPTLRR
ncbi:MAG: ATP-binding cassette domain-containing protein, partial [Ornithinimicrobium sp.]